MTDEKQVLDETCEPSNKPRHNSIYLLPNSFTIAALFAAFYAIIMATVHSRYEVAAIAVFISMILDGMDGRVARLTNSQSAFGEQLDSLADMVSFGVAPALIAYKWQLFQFGKIGYSIAFIYCACAALRLALFNTMIGKVDKKWFIGIPSPTAAALVAGFVWVYHDYGEKIPYIGVFYAVLTLFAGLTMVAQVKFWSFKELNVRRKVPFTVLLLAMIVILLIAMKPSVVLFAFFFVYSLSGYAMAGYRWLKQGKAKSVSE